EPAGREQWREHRLCDLHVGIERAAEGRGSAAARGEPAGVEYELRRDRSYGPSSANVEQFVRCGHVRDLGRVIERRTAGRTEQRRSVVRSVTDADCGAGRQHYVDDDGRVQPHSAGATANVQRLEVRDVWR